MIVVKILLGLAAAWMAQLAAAGTYGLISGKIESSTAPTAVTLSWLGAILALGFLGLMLK